MTPPHTFVLSTTQGESWGAPMRIRPCAVCTPFVSVAVLVGSLVMSAAAVGGPQAPGIEPPIQEKRGSHSRIPDEEIARRSEQLNAEADLLREAVSNDPRFVDVGIDFMEKKVILFWLANEQSALLIPRVAAAQKRIAESGNDMVVSERNYTKRDLILAARKIESDKVKADFDQAGLSIGPIVTFDKYVDGIIVLVSDRGKVPSRASDRRALADRLVQVTGGVPVEVRHSEEPVAQYDSRADEQSLFSAGPLLTSRRGD